MANTGIVYGGDIQVYRNTGTEETAVWAAFAHATSHSYSGSTSLREVLTKDTGGKKRVKPGTHETPTISIAGMVTYDGADFFDIEALRIARTRIHVKYSGRPTGDTLKIDTVEATGDKYMEGYGYITECSREDATDADATYSATITLEEQPDIKTKV